MVLFIAVIIRAKKSLKVVKDHVPVETIMYEREEHNIMELNIKNVSKHYKGRVWGLQDFSLKLGPGVLGLLGPNGSGKSTLMRIVSTITKPTSGVITWNGTDIVKKPDADRADLGYLPQDFGIYPNLNAIEFLEYMAAMKGLEPKSSHKRVTELIELLNLTGVCKRAMGGYSGYIFYTRDQGGEEA